MTNEERELTIKLFDHHYLIATDSIRGMIRQAGKLAEDYPGIEDSLPELSRAVSFIIGEWHFIHNKLWEKDNRDGK